MLYQWRRWRPIRGCYCLTWLSYDEILLLSSFSSESIFGFSSSVMLDSSDLSNEDVYLLSVNSKATVGRLQH
jgi:hypothetical protein